MNLYKNGMDIGHKYVVYVDSYYFIGIFHSYTTDELCFRDCIFFKPEEKEFVPWIHTPFKPIHWVHKHRVQQIKN